jgi:hypothetical protein
MHLYRNDETLDCAWLGSYGDRSALTSRMNLWRVLCWFCDLCPPTLQDLTNFGPPRRREISTKTSQQSTNFVPSLDSSRLSRVVTGPLAVDSAADIYARISDESDRSITSPVGIRNGRGDIIGTGRPTWRPRVRLKILMTTTEPTCF